MTKMIFDESYGELSYAQRAAYRKHNVTPHEHDDLVRAYGEDEHAKITAAVKQFSPSGYFDTSAWWEDHQSAWWTD